MSTIDFTWRPIDTLYFGPPASMVAGEVNGSRSLFPPPPMTFQGIVRTRLLAAAKLAHSLDDWSAAAKAEREALIGPPHALPAGWQLTGPFPATLGASVAPWLPTPRFALRAGGNEKRGAAPVLAHRIRSKSLVEHDLPSTPGAEPWDVGAPELDATEPLCGWVSPRNLRWLLAGDGEWDSDGFGPDLPPFVKRERRTGLAVDRQWGSAKDGLLYTLGTLRMAHGTGFLGTFTSSLDASLTAALTSGVGTAGRGARPVQFDAVGALDADWKYIRSGRHLPRNVDDGGTFWLVAIAPARVADPWQPLPPTASDVTIVVHAALVARPVVLGGMSMIGTNSRPNRAYVPAGSAWLIELRGGNADTRATVLAKLHDRPTIGDTEDHPFGFGHTLVGIPRRREEAA